MEIVLGKILNVQHLNLVKIINIKLMTNVTKLIIVVQQMIQLRNVLN